jgi:cold shock CspA family protein
MSGVMLRRINLPASVKWYNAKKGFGFVVLEGSGEELFVHGSVVREEFTLRRGDEVVVDSVFVEGKGEEVAAVKKHTPRENADSDIGRDALRVPV